MQTKKTNLFKKVIEYIKKKKPVFVEQDTINRCAIKIKPFCKKPFRFNYQYEKIKKDTVIKHFVSGIHINQKNAKLENDILKKFQTN